MEDLEHRLRAETMESQGAVLSVSIHELAAVNLCSKIISLILFI